MTKKNRLRHRDSQTKNLLTPPAPPVDWDETKPLFSLEYIGCKNYDLKCCDHQDKAIFLDAIYKRSGLTWKQIKSQPKDRLGWELLDNDKTNMKLREMAKKKLTEDVKIWVFRAKSKTIRRMVGHRDRQVFYILFLDPNGSLYEH